MKNKLSKAEIVSGLLTKYGEIINRQNLMEFCASTGINWPFWISDRAQHRAGRGQYTLRNLAAEFGVNIATAAISVPTVVTAEGVSEVLPLEVEPEKSDEDLADEIRDRFASLTRFAEVSVDGKLRSLIVSGNAGIGKTYTLEDIFERAAEDSKILYKSVKGYVRATGLYKLMWDNRHENCVILFDDADSIFQDEVALNLLKSALDTTRRRRVSWLSEKSFKDEAGEDIPDSFDFCGCIIFVTNLNFDRMSKTNNRLAPHFQALISRSFYIDLNLLSAREMMIRVEDVIQNSSILSSMGLSEVQSNFVLLFMKENVAALRELSLRMVIKLGRVVMAAKDERDFRSMAKSTCMIRG
jgi:hypothetical protein